MAPPDVAEDPAVVDGGAIGADAGAAAAALDLATEDRGQGRP